MGNEGDEREAAVHAVSGVREDLQLDACGHQYKTSLRWRLFLCKKQENNE